MATDAIQLEILCTSPALTPTVRDLSHEGRRLRMHVAHANARGLIVEITEADLQPGLLDEGDIDPRGARLLMSAADVRDLMAHRPATLRLRTRTGERMYLCRGALIAEAGDGADCPVCANAQRFAQVGEAAQAYVMRDGRLVADGTPRFIPSGRVRCGTCAAPVRSREGDGVLDHDLRERIRLAR